MQIITEHYATLEKAMRPVIAAHPNSRESYRAAGYTDKRFRTDLMYAAVGSYWVHTTLKTYLNSDQIDSVLRQIVGH